jgi:thiamine-monophosphate kinase
MRDEQDIIGRIQRQFPPRKIARKWLSIGVGDDAATLDLRGWGDHEMVLSTDWSLESIHFDARIHPPQVIGYRALARATSDLAAMGAAPRFFLLSLALLKSRAGGWLDRFAAGLAEAAREFGMELIGGDTSANSRIAISITVGGSVRRGHALTRSGARVGDQIFVSGTLGAAQLGLELLQCGAKPSSQISADERYAIERHLRPRIRIGLGQWLAGESPRGARIASAAIDTSDGLSTDLGHLCEMSEVGARIYARDIPMLKNAVASQHKDSRAKDRGSNSDALQRALDGGEDYELLFTVPWRTARRLPRQLKCDGGVSLTRIGEITKATRGSKSRIELISYSGQSTPLAAAGWDSFRFGT